MSFNDSAHWTLTQDANVPVTQVAGTGLQFAIGTGVGFSTLAHYPRDLTSTRTQVKMHQKVAQPYAWAPALRWELDANNYVQISAVNGQAWVDVCVAGTKVNRASTGVVNPTNLVIRARCGRIFFYYLTDGGGAISPASYNDPLYSCPAPFDLLYVSVKLIAGREQAGGTAATVILTDFSMTIHNTIWQDWPADDTTQFVKWASNGATVPDVSGGTMNCPIPVDTGGNVPTSGWYTSNIELDNRDGQHQVKIELPAGGTGLEALFILKGQRAGVVPDEGYWRQLGLIRFSNLTTGRELGWTAEDPVTGAAIANPGLDGSPGAPIPIGQDFVYARFQIQGGALTFWYSTHPDGWYVQKIGRVPCHDLLAGMLALRHDRIGAIGEEDIGAAFGDVPAIDVARRRLRARGPPVSCSAFCSSAARLPAFSASALANTSNA